jgi:rubrerythrin
VRRFAGGWSVKTILDCLNLARRIEVTSVEVYGHMRQTYTARFSEVLARILVEEEEHLRMVKRVLSTI